MFLTFFTVFSVRCLVTKKIQHSTVTMAMQIRLNFVFSLCCIDPPSAKSNIFLYIHKVPVAICHSTDAQSSINLQTCESLTVCRQKCWSAGSPVITPRGIFAERALMTLQIDTHARCAAHPSRKGHEL
jgi:hypothetical protein